MRTKQNLSLAILTFLVSMPIWAQGGSSVKQGPLVQRGNTWQQRLEFSSPVKEGARLVLRADRGTVSIRPTPGNQVGCVVILRAYNADEAKARSIFDRFQLSARPIEGGVYLSSESPQPARHEGNFGVVFRVTVPKNFNLDVETQGGDIAVEAPLEGEARLTTAGGDVHTSDVSGSLRIETAGGSIDLGNIGREATARTAGGSIHVGTVNGPAVLETSGGEIASGEVAGSLRAETAGGDVVLAGATGQVVAQTAGGQIQVGPTGGSVRAETAGGSIRLESARGGVVAETQGGSIDLLQVGGPARASTVAGRILAEFNATRKTFGPSELETSNGDVYVYLPTDLPLNIDAAIETAAGRQIHSDFPLDIQGMKEDLVPTTLRGRGALNGGGQTLRIRTVAGNIEIRKIDEATLRDLQQREANSWDAWQQRHAEKERQRLEREKQRRERQQEGDQDHDD